MKKLFCILILALASTLAYAQRPDQIELPCPAGSSPTWMGQSYNQATGKYRQWQCVNNRGVVSTNSPDSGSQVFNVKAYGAAGDGVTDDNAAIQAAINAAEAVHGVVFFPAATYVSDENLLVTSEVVLEGVRKGQYQSSSNISFKGNGGGACSPGTNGYLEIQAGNVTVDGLSMSSAQPTAGTCIINWSKPGNGEVSGVYLLNSQLATGSGTSTDNGLAIGNSDTIQISNNTMQNLAKMVYSVGTSTSMISADIGPRNTFAQCTDSSDYMLSFGTGGEVDDVDTHDNVFEGSTACNNGVMGGDVIHNWFGDAGSIGTWILSANVVLGNTIQGSGLAIHNASEFIGNSVAYSPAHLPYSPMIVNNSFHSGAYVELQDGTAFSQGNSFDGTAANDYTCYVGPCNVISYGDSSSKPPASNVTIVALTPTAPVTLSGTTAGSLSWAWSGGAGDKKVTMAFNGYENTSTTAQAITSLPMAYSYTPNQGSGCPTGLTVSSATVTLPTSMSAPFTGQCIVEGQ